MKEQQYIHDLKSELSVLKQEKLGNDETIAKEKQAVSRQRDEIALLETDARKKELEIEMVQVTSNSL